MMDGAEKERSVLSNRPAANSELSLTSVSAAQFVCSVVLLIPHATATVPVSRQQSDSDSSDD